MTSPTTPRVPAVRRPLAPRLDRPALVTRRLAEGEFEPSYVTRKRMTPQEVATAAGVGVGLALVGFYFAKLWLERDPVLPPVRLPADPGDATTGTMHRTITPRRAAP